ncbi:MAG: type II secretion system protein GspG [Opitutaceae bacterium]
MKKKGIIIILKASLLLAVISLISIGAILLIASRIGIPNSPERIAKNKTQAHIQSTFSLGLIPYRLDIGSYPTTKEGLGALLHPPEGKQNEWKGPYLKELPLDAWNQPFQYRFPGVNNMHGSRSYDLWSWGPDGVQSDDDIENWEEPRS